MCSCCLLECEVVKSGRNDGQCEEPADSIIYYLEGGSIRNISGEVNSVKKTQL